MADLDVQVQLSLRDDMSRPAKKAMDAVHAAARKAKDGMDGMEKETRKAGDAVEGMGRAARDAGEAVDGLGKNNGPRNVKQQADGAARSLENMDRNARRAGQSLSQADAQAGRLRRTLDGVSSRMQAVTRQAARLGQGLGTGINGAVDAGAGIMAAGAVGRTALAAPMARERQYLQDATVAFNERTEAGIKAGVAELRALDQQIVARGGGTLDSARAMRGAFLAGGMSFEDTQALAPLTQRAATAAGAEGADFANTLLSGTKSGQFTKDDAEKVFGMMLTAGASGSFETRDMAQYLPSIFNATGDMRGLRGTAQHLTGLEIVRDAAGNSAEAANNYENLLSFRNSPEAYKNLEKRGIYLAHVYSDAAKRGEDMNLAFTGAIQSLVERNKAYQRYKKQLAGASGEEAIRIRNEMNVIQDRIFGEIIGDRQAREGAKALENARGGRYSEVYAGVTKDPEAMIDKLFSVMTSSTQENLNRLANEWEKGMDRVLDVVKGPLQDAIQWASGLMADHPELTAAAAGAVTVGGMAAAGSGVAAGLRGLRGLGGRAAGAPAATGPQATPQAPASGTGRGGQATGQGGRPGGSTTHKANTALVVLSAAGQAYATETDDSLTREQKNAAHAETAGGAVGALAGAQAGAAVGAAAGPVGAAVGSVAGGVIGGLAGSELGKKAYAYHQQVQQSLNALPYDPDDPDAYLRNLSARAEATGQGPEQRESLLPQGLADLLAAFTGGGGLPAPQPSPEEWKAVLLEAAKDMQTAAQAQPVKVELHSTLELDGAVLAQSREDIMIREAARR